MKLYTTNLGIARQETLDTVAVLDIREETLDEVLQGGMGLDRLADAPSVARCKLSELEVFSPVICPSKVFCMGANYHGHVAEMRQVLETLQPDRVEELIASTLKTPVFFGVPSSAITGPFADIPVPEFARGQLDYEAELAVVIGKGGRNISAEHAWDYVAGLTMSNDISARDIQGEAMAGPQFEFAHAKGIDGFKPLGPSLVTMDEFNLPLDIKIEAKINGEVRQAASTTEQVHDIPTCISYISRFHTLRAGDVILTGSPAGVGYFQGQFLKEGDLMEMSAQNIGTIANKVKFS